MFLREDDLTDISPIVFSKIVAFRTNYVRYTMTCSLIISLLIFIYADFRKLAYDHLVVLNVTIIFLMLSVIFGAALESLRNKYFTYSELFLTFWAESSKINDPQEKLRLKNMQVVLSGKIRKMMGFRMIQNMCFMLALILVAFFLIQE